MEHYLEQLNKSQRDAVENFEGPSLVIAGAGSGKTRVLTYRIAYLLHRGIRASNVLALTFTNKAAREMKERIALIVGPDNARHLWMGTFHSIFARILRYESEALGFPSNFTIYDTADARSLIKSILKSFHLDDKTYKPSVVLNRISAAKNSLINAQMYAQTKSALEYDASIRMPKISEIYTEYTRRCNVSGAMDFDDLLMKIYYLFQKHPEILKKYQDKFRYILVDEYQDTNRAQYLIIKALASDHSNICVVGDDAQSIYSFRGARIENILNFQTDYPTHEVFKLEQNYRSTKNIVNAANSVIARNKKQLKKNVFSENEDGEKIKVFSALTDNEEGTQVVNEIFDLHSRDHFDYSDFAILYRTNAQSRIFEEALRKRNLPYKIFGGLSFYQRKEIKDILGYFRMVINPLDNEAFKRVINYPTRGIGATTIGKLENEANATGLSIWDVVQNLEHNNAGLNKGTIAKVANFVHMIQRFTGKLEELDAFDLANEIANETGLLKDLYQDKSPEGLSKFENIQELLNGLQEFTTNGREQGEPNGLHNYMEDVALLTDQDNEKDEDRNRVTLMTVHSAKGLEFKVVFVVGMEDKLFPSQYSGAISLHELEEERRLFYVAITRAEKRAYLAWAKQRYQWGKLAFCEPSRFLSEVDSKYMDGASGYGQRHVGGMKATGGLAGTTSREKRAVKKPAIQPNLASRLMSLRKTTGAAVEFEGDDPRKIQAGMMVEHQRFGSGKVIQIEGTYPDIKATVFFKSAGQKQLLLKFAKLKIIG
ncbi:ATP-dependent DNA helicase [Prolixibacteraceae bacterium JC049]|nr:ATP-dependent DNA helicase [Prolixibacteraceae bacterium JC049]